MPQRKRAKRPTIERAEPRRNFSGAFRAGASDGAAPAPPAAGSTANGEHAPATNGAAPEAEWEAARDAGYEAINNGYRVIDEYMRQGQKFAEEFWLPSPEAKSGGSDLSRMMDRFLRSAGDMGSAWLEMMTQWTQAPGRDAGGPRGTAGPFSAGAYAGTNGHAAASQSVPLALDVEASRRVRVSVDCREPSPALEVHALVGSNPAAPAMTGVRVDVEPRTGAPTLHVSVPADQPPGVYHGVLVDRAAERPVGTVTVTVF